MNYFLNRRMVHKEKIREKQCAPWEENIHLGADTYLYIKERGGLQVYTRALF
ncbi:hypothetical protein [Nitrosomonas communis]|uniref:Uncharacterized protein n=1 Tax=Nitrosomonas communis TaxID=44574 RepID=A0A1H3A1A8_9PROT|nr:hypothetical protein [Nitrosomonas communis]SDX23562.1 hypothetical protein SAMN05421882_11092 [Nitrosomonas communis]